MIDNRRKEERRIRDRCVAVVGEQILPVQDWSYGGALLTADNRLYEPNQKVDLTLKFRLRDQVLDIKHTGRIVRMASGKIALMFDPAGQAVKRMMQFVVDDSAAQEFANSQI